MIGFNFCTTVITEVEGKGFTEAHRADQIMYVSKKRR